VGLRLVLDMYKQLSLRFKNDNQFEFLFVERVELYQEIWDIMNERAWNAVLKALQEETFSVR
jgi:hypothetical protein